MGKYTLIKQIGTGAYSTVYLATPTSAVKMIPRTADSNNKNILQEIQTAEKARHRNLVLCLEVMTTKNNYYFVFEYCDKGDLKKYLIHNKVTLN